MKTYLTSGFATALIVSAAFGGTALAQSPQYEPYAESPPSVDDRQVDVMSTGSINGDSRYMLRGPNMSDTYVDGSQDTGDYYDGAMRPTN